jgi:hypothetical protein
MATITLGARRYTFGQLRKAFINVVGLVLLGATFALDKTANLPGWATTALGSVVAVGTIITHFSTANDAVLTQATDVLDTTPLTAGAAQALVEKLVGAHLDHLLSGAPTVLTADTATPVTAPPTPAPVVLPTTATTTPDVLDLGAAVKAALEGTTTVAPGPTPVVDQTTAAPAPAPRPVLTSATEMPAGALPAAPANA